MKKAVPGKGEHRRISIGLIAPSNTKEGTGAGKRTVDNDPKRAGSPLWAAHCHVLSRIDIVAWR
ncbi:MAG TPA: hypothetical protein VEI28_03675 [Thermodesulfovibrionales bacterium]|nr:hypothetical protein [Thermodesulfovibrionales bacterium]